MTLAEDEEDRARYPGSGPFKMTTRELLKTLIKDRYLAGLDEVSTRGYKDYVDGKYVNATLEEIEHQIEQEQRLHKGKITIEEYLEPLTDFQLIMAYDDQCCLKYR